MRIDFDSAWKDTTEVYFTALLELLDTPGLPSCIDREPVIGLDQELQEVARALGDDGNAEEAANRLGSDASMAGLDGQPCQDERHDRRRSRRRSRRLRVDKLVRVPLPEKADSEPGADGYREAPRSAGPGESMAKSAARSVARSPVPARPPYWLAHIEVQTQRDPTLPRRLFDYHYHIERRHRCRVITFAILGDLSPSWRPGNFSSDVPPLGMGLGYVSIKLIDLEQKIELPRFRGNPVAMVIRAHLAALRTRHNLEARLTQRLALCRRLYEEGFSQKDVVFIHGLIDRLMILPRPLMMRFKQELFTLENDKNMPYVDTLTRMSRQEGRQEGSLAQARESVIEALEIRFGEVPTDLRERIGALDNLRTLKAQLRRAITVPSLDQF